jgi:hypothetical protein
MFRKMLCVLAALIVLLLHGCTSGVQVRVDYDPKDNFGQYRTYAWAPPTAEERQEKERNSLLHERIHAAVDAHFAARGYQKVDVSQADFQITYTVTVERRTQLNESRVSLGYGRYGARGGVGISTGFPIGTTIEEYKVGTLIIDVIDGKQKRLVWRGSGDRTIGESYTPEERTKIVNTVVNEILGRFPPVNKKAP